MVQNHHLQAHCLQPALAGSSHQLQLVGIHSFDSHCLEFESFSVFSTEYSFDSGNVENISGVFAPTVPFVVKRGMPLQGYLAHSIHGGGIELPLFNSQGECRIHATEKGLDIYSADRLIGNWSYWNEGWQATTDKGSKGHHGKKLVIHDDCKNLIAGLEDTPSFIVRYHKYSRASSRSEDNIMIYRGITVQKSVD